MTKSFNIPSMTACGIVGQLTESMQEIQNAILKGEVQFHITDLQKFFHFRGWLIFYSRHPFFHSALCRASLISTPT